MFFGAIEASGAKFVCCIGTEKGEIMERVSFATETPEITMEKVISFFKNKKIEAIGIGCFGPIDLHKDSETYGYITSTRKLFGEILILLERLKKLLIYLFILILL